MSKFRNEIEYKCHGLTYQIYIPKLYNYSVNPFARSEIFIKIRECIGKI